MASIAEHQRQDTELVARILCTETGAIPDDTCQAKKFALDAWKFTLLDGVLYFIDLSYPTVSAIAESHSAAFSGHFTECGLYKKIAKLYWWPLMNSDV